jgi:6-carboxyhexanoate--CoA ligase
VLSKAENQWLFSVRMRAAAMDHSGKEVHLSGCERLVADTMVPTVLQTILERSAKHSNGEADRINISIDRVSMVAVKKVPALPIRLKNFPTIGEAHEHATRLLINAGVSENAAKKGVATIRNLKTSMRGGMIMESIGGERVDNFRERGVRLSHMDCESEGEFLDFLSKNSANGTKTREAVILASKAAAADGYVAELCWSDDRDYTTGYVACGKFYTRIAPMKTAGSTIGGRIFFICHKTNVEATIDYFEKQPVLVCVKP